MNSKLVQVLYFEAAAGDSSAYYDLQKEFLRIGNTLVSNILANYHIYCIPPEYFSDELIRFFPITLGNYNPKCSNFKTYSNLALNSQIHKWVTRLINSGKTETLSLNTSYENDIALIDQIEDKSIKPFCSDMDLTMVMSSKNSKGDRTYNNILKLQKAGFKRKEICEILKISKNQLRYIIDKNRNISDKMQFEIK